MTLGIIGETKLAATLGNRFIARGVDVVFGVREEFNSQLIEWKILQLQKSKVSGYCEAIKDADIILICCENENLPIICNCLINSTIKEKLIIDCTNGQYQPELGCNTSYIQKISGHKKVIKAFNNLGLDYPHSDPLGLVKETYYCGDESADKSTAKRLIELIGLKAIDAGKLKNAFLLEAVYHLRQEISFLKTGGMDCHFRLLTV
ncbi:MAG: NAD(P)-binding domain-containing protein [Anditalea sp.]